MKLKYPKKIKIGCNVFDVLWDTTSTEANFEYFPKQFIEIGLKGRSTLQVIDSIIHELKEIINIEQSTRLTTRDTEYRFMYNHQQHDDLCSRLAGLLDEFIK